MKECSKCRSCFNDEVILCPHDGKTLVASIDGDGVIGGRYVLEKRLGKGGMGIVFQAQHKFLKSSHAIKVILPNLVEDDESLLVRFRQEAILAASIHHPNVVGVTDFGVEDNMPYLVMEYVDGISLSAHLGKGAQLAPEKVYEIFLPIAVGVGEAHRKGIVHRDLKPQNIIVQKGLPLRQAIKVLDFGLAKIKTSESLGSFVQAQTVSILGSPPYMSPEQWSNGEVDNRADIYALGVMLYEMLTGHLPFDGDSIPAIVYQHLTVDPPAFATHGITLAPRIEAVVNEAIKKDRNERPNSVEELLAKFEESLVSANIPLPSQFDNNSFAGRKTQGFDDKTISIAAGDNPLSATQKDRLYSYLDIPTADTLVADENLAQKFLQAQERAEEAKVQVSEADRLVQEFAEAQRLAEEAQQKAVQAQKKIENEVRKRVESEMESKLAAEQQARQKAEAETRQLVEEAEARKAAEERANQLAEAALAAQKLAEDERKNAEREAHQRELEEGVRRQAENNAQQLAAQAVEAKRKYEEARQEADREARLRVEAEAKREKIENDLQVLAHAEAERRKVAEAEADKQVREQADLYEQQAVEARQKVEDARRLAEFESNKRAEAEAAQRRSEEEAKKLADQIIQVQQRMDQIERSASSQYDSSSMKTISLLHPNTDETLSQTIAAGSQKSNTSPDIVSGKFPQPSADADATHAVINFDANAAAHIGQSGANIAGGQQISAGLSQGQSNSAGFLNSNANAPAKKLPFMLIAAVIGGLFLLVAGVGGFYFLGGKSDNKPNQNQAVVINNAQKPSNDPTVSSTGNRIAAKMALISGGTFQMGVSDVSPQDLDFGNQYPAHAETVDSFYIDKTEVSNAEYAEFVKAAKYPAPVTWSDGKPPSGAEKLPVTGVSQTDAKQFAKWVSEQEKAPCRLPEEKEWEFAARNGSKQTLYPWGNDWKPESANVTSQKIAEIGTYADETATGIKDMLGNVAEWTATKAGAYPGGIKRTDYKEQLFIVRGSYFSETQTGLKNQQWMATRRREITADEKTAFLGFRLICEKK